MPRLGARRQNLVILAACGGAALLFIGGGLLYVWSTDSRKERQDDMLAAAPQTLAEGAASNLFVLNGPAAAAENDITGYHPAYLVGAISQAFNGDLDCSPPNARFGPFTANCGWGKGVISVFSNTSPASLLHKSANLFDVNGLPINDKGIAISPSDFMAMPNNAAQISYEDTTPRWRAVANQIIFTLSGKNLSDIDRNGNGSWFPARENLGFKICHFSYLSTYLLATCYQKS